MRRHLLLFLSLSILLPSLAVLGGAGFGLIQVQKALQSVTRSYVRNLAESMSGRLDGAWAQQRQTFGSHHQGMMGTRFLSRDLLIPGLVAVMDAQGRFVLGSPGSEPLTLLWRQGMPLGEAVEARGNRGERYTVAAYPAAENQLFVVAAVSWDDLLGPVLRVATLWPFFAGLVGLGGLLAVGAFGRWVVWPLRRLMSEVSALRWGEDAPALTPYPAVPELLGLRRTITHLALTAIDRASLNKRYVGDLIRVQEEEKSHLSREIHDGPLQAVTALIQRVRLARMEARDPQALEEQLRLAETIAQECVKELRGLCDELNPPWLELGFEQALTELVSRLQQQWPLDLHLEFGVHEELDREETLALFRVVQEGVHNAARHGGARRVEISLGEDGGHLCLSLRDDGVGFVFPEDLRTLRLQGHRGLANMQERMALVGGRLEVRTAPGEGTEILCWLKPRSSGADEAPGTEEPDEEGGSAR